MKPVIAELSAGAIVYRKKDENVEILLLLNKGEHYEFPIGHIEKNESLFDAAKREVKEETGISLVELNTDFHEYFTVRKEYLRDISYKTIHLFLVKTDEEITISTEHLKYKWASIDEAIELLHKKEYKEVLKEAKEKNVFS